MDLYLYSFSKKERSTKRPTGGLLLQGNLREPSGFLSPSFSIQMEAENDPAAFNYCYIPEFSRYYWIDEWTFIHGCLWMARTHVDVLATWRDQIGSKEFYILRSSAAYNGRVVDTKYPTLTKPSSYIDSLGDVYEESELGDILRGPYWDRDIASGYFFMGVVGPNETGATWYAMSPSSFNTVVDELYAFDPDDMPSLDKGLRMKLADPIQYVVNCYWLPTAPLTLRFGTRTINFGFYPIEVEAAAIVDPVADIVRYHADFPIRKHPQAATRGSYLNQAPTTRYTVVFQPFGTFELDTSLMIDDTKATASWYIDYTTGIADLTIKVTNSFMVHTQNRLGVPIRLNQTTVDYGAALTGFVGGVGTAAIGMMSGNIPMIIGGTLGAIGTGVSAMLPKLSSTGGGGSFIPFHSVEPRIYSDFYPLTNEFNEEIGRPLCEVRTPASLGGFIMALEGDIDIPATSAELSAISGYLTGGFFYE